MSPPVRGVVVLVGLEVEPRVFGQDPERGSVLELSGLGVDADGVNIDSTVQPILRDKLGDRAFEQACKVLSDEFGFEMPNSVKEALLKTLGPCYGDHKFFSIMNFMTGLWAPDVHGDNVNDEGKVRCMTLVYAGENAVAKIRDILGPTDPSQAAPGSVRKEFGTDIMINAAHASDSPENALREIGIVNVQQDTIKRWYECYYT